MNILYAIQNLVERKDVKIGNIPQAVNRMNSQGEGLEAFVEQLFLNMPARATEEETLERRKEVFSYKGNANNPPDFMLRNKGDAIEVKKVATYRASLALNSSPPKAKLFSDDSRITKACREAEKELGEWDERDMLYVIGVLPKASDKLTDLAFVYGETFMADREVYDKIYTAIKQGIMGLSDIEFDENTNELSGVKKVDPLGITNLRVRGMWHIQSPFKVFDYKYEREEDKAFNFFGIIPFKKWQELEIENSEQIEVLSSLSKVEKSFRIRDTEVRNPNNPAETIKVKLITYSH